jgi:hypothetical protein
MTLRGDVAKSSRMLRFARDFRFRSARSKSKMSGIEKKWPGATIAAGYCEATRARQQEVGPVA